MTGTTAYVIGSNGVMPYNNEDIRRAKPAAVQQDNSVTLSQTKSEVKRMNMLFEIVDGIFANGSLGISLTANSNIPKVNDPGDADTGANGFQNYPVLRFAGPSGSHSVVGGTLNSTGLTR